ncbi:MAG TPA: 4Fe-4S dicluster domain-containing protein [Clostridia bacterium]|nr:4Fe-4S dicluster domain-containing protein [Clostridia bacterium]
MEVRRQIGFYVDSTKCINCKTCEVACKDFNDAPVGRRIRKVRTFEGGEFPKVFAYNISMSCNHCEDPLCVKHCPAAAYTKRPGDGIVVHDPARCIGCRYCTWVCPYGAPQFDASEGRVRKCNLCVDEIDSGNSPVCVISCPMRAIEIGELAEIATRPGATIRIRALPSPELTRPSCRYKVRAEAADD